MNRILRLLTLTALLPATFPIVGQPQITTGPTDQSASLNATVQFRVAARTSGGTLMYRWWFKDVAIDPATNPTATRNTLILSNVTAAAAGAYRAVVSDVNGSTASQSAVLTVDSTFWKVTEGPVVTDRESSIAGNWCDYDSDGLPDLLVLNYWWPNVQKLSLYHNEGQGTFTKVTNAITSLSNQHVEPAWADFDNDGDPDLFVSHVDRTNSLYRNDGRGEFVPVHNALTRSRHRYFLSAWADSDRDGWLDLFVGTLVGDGSSFVGHTNDFLFRNTGTDFVALDAETAGEAVTDAAYSFSPSWCDFDNDGDMDLYVAVRNAESSLLYRNDGAGRFERVILGSIPSGPSYGASWADVNNDGFFDLYVFGGTWPVQSLHVNRGGQTFEEVTEVAGLASEGSVWGPAFGDFDNDGDVDLFVPVINSANVLYRNDGDGTFTNVDVGSPLTEGRVDQGASWMDYDNDGFLDLSVPCGEGSPAVNLLYRNSLPGVGNVNHWLKVKVEGTVSNRQGLGAKVRVCARIGGRQVWQLRQMASNSIPAGGSEFLAHFGLGDATRADVVRIEWPSGIVQELTSVASKQVLTVTEPPRLHALGAGRVRVQCWKGQAFEVEASSNLESWTSLGTRRNETGTLEVTDADAGQYAYRYYRAKGQ